MSRKGSSTVVAMSMSGASCESCDTTEDVVDAEWGNPPHTHPLCSDCAEDISNQVHRELHTVGFINLCMRMKEEEDA